MAPSSVQVALGPELLPGATCQWGWPRTHWLSSPPRLNQEPRSHEEGQQCPHARAHTATQQGAPPPSTPHPHPPTPDLTLPAALQRPPSPQSTARAPCHQPARNTPVRLVPRTLLPPGSKPPWCCHASLFHTHHTHSHSCVHMRARSQAHTHAHSHALTRVHTLHPHSHMPCSYANSHVHLHPAHAHACSYVDSSSQKAPRCPLLQLWPQQAPSPAQHLGDTRCRVWTLPLRWELRVKALVWLLPLGSVLVAEVR